MNAKRFALCLSLAVVLAILSVWGLTWILPEMRYMNQDYSAWIQQRDYTLRNDDKQEILLLGDSRVKEDVFPEEFHPDAYNLSLGAGTPIDIYYTLKDYMQHHPKPRMVVVAFAPFHFCRIAGFTGANAYFHYLSADELREVNRTLRRMDGKDYWLDTEQCIYRLPSVYMKPVVKSILFPQTQRNESRYKQIAADKGHLPNPSAQMRNVMPPETEDAGFVPLASQTYYMEQIIKLCVNNGVELHVEQTPISSYGLKKLQENGYLAAYQEYLKGFADRYDVDVTMELPGYDDEYFGDYSHLNEQGAHIFTRKLRERYFGAED